MRLSPAGAGGELDSHQGGSGLRDFHQVVVVTILPKLSPIGGWYKLSSTFTRCRGDEKTRQGLACGPRLAVAGREVPSR